MPELILAGFILLVCAATGIVLIVRGARNALSRDRKLEELEEHRDKLANWIDSTMVLANRYYSEGNEEMGQYVERLADAKRLELQEARRKVDAYVREELEKEALEN